MRALLILTFLLSTPAAFGRNKACDAALDEYTLPRSLKVLVWNVHKFDDSRTVCELADMAEDADLVLLQEQDLTGMAKVSCSAAVKHLNWSFTIAYRQSGLATGSPKQALRTESYHTTVTEPLLNSQKSWLVNEFKISGSSERLLVINVHAINFRLLNKFKIQINEILERIRQHRGPVLVAGDFNTWPSGRFRYLATSLGELGIEYLHSGALRRYLLSMDHIFARGLELKQVHNTSTAKSSDHLPIAVQLELAGE